MRIIYCDEAGTSEHEPFRVVVGVHVVSDLAWREARAALQSAVDRHVPDSMRQGFIFHAKDVFGGRGKVARDSWPLESRMALFKDVLAIPPTLRMPVSIGAVAAARVGLPEPARKAGITANLWSHIMATFMMLEAADRDIRKRGAPEEVAVLVFEQLPERARHLKRTLRALQRADVRLPPDHFHPWTTQHPENFRMAAKHLVDAAHFADKSEAPLLQIADAWAFGIRRRLCNQPYADVLLQAMIGRPDFGEEWCNPSSSVTFAPR